jgi:hypothetical protein
MLVFAVGCSSASSKEVENSTTMDQRCQNEAAEAIAKAAECKVAIPTTYASDYRHNSDTCIEGAQTLNATCSDQCIQDITAMSCEDLKYVPAPTDNSLGDVGYLTLPMRCVDCKGSDINTCPDGAFVACPCANGKHGMKDCGAADSTCFNCV